MSYKFKPKIQTGLDDMTVTNVETLGLVSLEPRILLDAAGFVTGAEVAAEAVAAEGAEIGVQAIFEGEQDSAEPVGGPWLGELTLTDASDTSNGNIAGDEPVGGPWLGDLAAEPVGGPWLGDVSDEPVGGPWL